MGLIVYHADGKTPLAAEETLLHRALHGDQVEDVEMVLCARGATPRTFLANAQLITDARGRRIGAVAVMHDVTERKRLEERFNQAQKMKAFGQLAGGVAHDFNNLLTVILGYSEMMLSSLSPEDGNGRLVREIHEAGERAALLTRQLLAFSRKQVVHPEVLDLNAVVERARTMLERLIEENVSLTTVLHPVLDGVKVDAGQIEQVIMNLVLNARDAMPGGGDISIATSHFDFEDGDRIDQDDMAAGRYVMLSVSDTGCGISEEVMQHIFEPFFTTKDVGKGTGLGLATVSGILGQSGAHIRVSSEVGKGTTFKIYFPAVLDVDPALQMAPRPSGLLQGSETILLVEDEATVRKLIRVALSKRGYEVLECAGAEHAIQLCEQRQGPVDLLVCDVVMPRVGGRQLAEQLSALHPEMRVLFVSGYTDDAVVRQGVLQAEVEFLQKPFTMNILANKVRDILDGPEP